MTPAYAGVGARATPPDVLALMEALGHRLALDGWTLRSGGADGADAAFERGADAAPGPKEIYLPWHGFNGRSSPHCRPGPTAFALAESHHPAWARLSPAARKLQARNGYQVLGPHLDDPSRFVLCWTPGARVTGGTGQALRLARARGVEVRNLADPTVRASAEAYAFGPQLERESD